MDIIKKLDKRSVVYAGLIIILIFIVHISAVSASTPDSSGNINGCYRNNGGDLRIRDIANPSDTCSNKETSISWTQGGAQNTATAVAYITYNASLSTATIDSMVSRGVTDINESTESLGLYCITTNIDPKIAIINSNTSASYNLRTAGVWKSYGFDYLGDCDMFPSANVAVNVSSDLSIFLSE